MASTAPLARVFADFEAAAQSLDTHDDDGEAWELLDAAFGFDAGSVKVPSTSGHDGDAGRLRELLDVLQRARSLVDEAMRNGGDAEAAHLADLEYRVRDLLERVQAARRWMDERGGRSQP